MEASVVNQERSGGETWELDGVVVAETVLSDVDGERGRLVLAGHDVEEVALSATFEDGVGLLRNGVLPDAETRAQIQKELGIARIRAFERLGTLGSALDQEDGCDALRAALAHGVTTDVDEGLALAGATAVYAAAHHRRMSGEQPVAPEPGAPHTAVYLRMVHGGAPAPALVRALDTYLVTISDHGMNASTFAARVVASTASDATGAIVAAVGALKGPLHGGAPGPVLDMLDAVAEPSRALLWLEEELAAKRRIMGMGHRVYRVRDPRAAVLEAATRRLGQAGIEAPRLLLAQAVERAAEGVLRERYPSRPLRANVEFYTAVLLDTLGLPRELFTPTFAVGRVVGWYAHVLEQRRTGRLIRPASRYVGPPPKTA